MKNKITKILTNNDFINLKKLNTLSTNPIWNETRIVIIPHSYRDETIELVELEHYEGD